MRGATWENAGLLQRCIEACARSEHHRRWMDVCIMKSCLHGGILEKGTETRG